MPAEGAAPLAVALPDEAATARLAEDVAAVLRPGDLVALSGGLGAGKSTFARALLRSLAGDPAYEAPSPTFPLRIDHPLPRLPVVHADLYRLDSADALDEVGLDEALAGAALLVEWPEALPAGFAADRLDVALAIAGAGRQATLAGSGDWPARLARSRTIRGFLDGAGWADAARIPLAGDASTRAYERIAHSSRAETGILMNAPARAEGPALYDGRSYDSLAHRALDVKPFVAIGSALQAAGIRAPAVRAADLQAGLLLLEDLSAEGIVDDAGAPIPERYLAAVDLLAAMHGRDWPANAPLPDGTLYRVSPYDREALLVEISLFPDWFGRGHGGEPAFPSEERPRFLAVWSEVLAGIEGGPTTWVMRDFHSPNILWQAEAAGTDRVAVLDFQDALVGDPAYDVASLAQDARVDVSPELEAALKARYIALRSAADPAFDAARFERAYAVLGAQRATKVLGGFTRLALADNKPGYQRHRARLKRLLARLLRDPVLFPLRLWYEPYL